MFDVDANGETPVLTWTGCIMTPDGMAANSVASSSDGSLLATIPLHTGNTISEAMAGNSMSRHPDSSRSRLFQTPTLRDCYEAPGR